MVSIVVSIALLGGVVGCPEEAADTAGDVGTDGRNNAS
jgi:hypothetical protein